MYYFPLTALPVREADAKMDDGSQDAFPTSYKEEEQTRWLEDASQGGGRFCQWCVEPCSSREVAFILLLTTTCGPPRSGWRDSSADKTTGCEMIPLMMSTS